MAVTLNSLPVFPSDIQLETTKIGVSLVAANGTRRFAHRLSGATPIYKRTWKLLWDSASAAERTTVVAVYAYTVSFSFVDQYGGAWTVQCEDGGYSESVAFVAKGGTLYYDLGLTLLQT